MDFGTIYWPVACALLTVFAITEVFHILVGFWLHKRQERKMKEAQADMQAQGLDPFMVALMGGAGLGPPPGFNPDMPAEIPSEGTQMKDGKNDGTGGYL